MHDIHLPAKPVLSVPCTAVRQPEAGKIHTLFMHTYCGSILRMSAVYKYTARRSGRRGSNNICASTHALRCARRTRS